MVGAGATAVLVDDRPAEDEVAPTAPAWSPRARMAAVAGVLLVVVGVLLVRPEPEVVYEPRGFTARGDATRSGVVSLAPLDVPTRVAWTADVGAARTSSRVRAAGDLVLEQTGGGILAARDAATGAVRWLRRDLVGGGPAVRVGDVVVVASDVGPLRGLSAADGVERWRLDDVGAAVLVPHGDDVVVRSSDRTRSLVAATGDARWELDDAVGIGGTVQRIVPGGAGLGLWTTSPPGLPVDSPRVAHRLLLLDPATGAVRLAQPLAPPVADAPIAVGARHVAWTSRGEVTVATPDGEVVHRLPDAGGALAATGDLLAVARRSGGVVGIDLRTGADRWSRPDVATDDMVAADGVVVTADGTVIDAVTGRTRSAQQRLTLDALAGETTLLALPAIAGAEVEIRDRSGSTVARAPLLADEAAAPAVGAGRVFVPTRDGVEVFAVDDGVRDWSFSQLPTSPGLGGRRATARTPAVAGTTVLVSPGTGFGRSPSLVALELTGGVRTWDREGDAPIVRGPLTLAGDVAFVPVGGEIHAYDATTGRRAFAAVAGTKRGPVVVSPNRVIGGPETPVVAAGAEAVAILRRDRSENWRAPLVPCSGPVLAGDRVAWGTPRGVTALEEPTGEVAWELATDRPVCLDPVAAAGLLVVVEDPTTLLAVPVADGGTPRWSTELPAPAVASPVLAGRQVLVPLLDGTLAAYDLEDGAPAWSFDLGGVADASPAVLEGRILVHLRDGRLLALAP